MEQNREEQIRKIIQDWESADKMDFTTEMWNKERVIEQNTQSAVSEWAKTVQLTDVPTSIPLDLETHNRPYQEVVEDFGEDQRLCFRDDLINMLVKLKAQDVALRLINNINSQEDRGFLHEYLIESLVNAGDLDRARSIIWDVFQKEYPTQRLFDNLLKICARHKTDKDLNLLRNLAEVAAMDPLSSIVTETSNWLEIYAVLSKEEDLLKARKLAQSTNNCLDRGRCYRRIAHVTSKCEDYLAAYSAFQQMNIMNTKHALDAAVFFLHEVQHLNTNIWYKLTFCPKFLELQKGEMMLDDDVSRFAPMEIEEYKKLLLKLTIINQRWADALKEKVDPYLDLK